MWPSGRGSGWSRVADWVSLVVPAAAALSGVALTQWAASRQARARVESDRRGWLDEKRADAHIDFLVACDEHRWLATRQWEATSEWDPKYNWTEDLQKLFVRIRVYGSPEVYELAVGAAVALEAAVRNASAVPRSTGRGVVEALLDMSRFTALLKQVRKELDVDG